MTPKSRRRPRRRPTTRPPHRPPHRKRKRRVEEIVSPGAHESRPGSITVMKNDNASERAAALLNQVVDVLQCADRAPASPVNAFVPAKLRRKLRRSAAYLRAEKSQPLHKA